MTNPALTEFDNAVKSGQRVEMMNENTKRIIRLALQQPTLRDLFAMNALAALIPCRNIDTVRLVEEAFQFADEAMKQRGPQ